MVLNMMIGIRKSITSLYFGHHDRNKKFVLQDGTKEGELYNDYILKNTFQLIKSSTFQLIKSRNKYFDQTQACRFIDYAPKVFYNIRLMYGISSIDFLKSVGPEQVLENLIMGNLTSLSELMSAGKSGSFFYYSSDSKYMLKTIPDREFKAFLKMLKPYYLHMERNYHTMVA